jgi:hypothetical protein
MTCFLLTVIEIGCDGLVSEASGGFFKEAAQVTSIAVKYEEATQRTRWSSHKAEVTARVCCVTCSTE